MRDVVVLSMQGALLIALAIPFGLRAPAGSMLLSGRRRKSVGG